MPIYPYSFQLPPLNVQDIPNDGAPGEFLGINVGGALDWLPVATGGGDMLKSENLSGLANYTTARTNIGLGTASTPTFANLTLTSPSLSSSAPVTISQTWAGTGSTVFKALVVNAVSTASASGSLLLDLQLGGVSQLSVTKAGAVNVTGAVSTPAQFIAGDAIFANGNGVRYVSTWIRSAGFDGGLLFRNNTQTQSVGVVVEADNTLALRNGAAAQTFRVYGAYPDTGINYARLALSCDTSGNATISTQALGTYTAGTVSINGIAASSTGTSLTFAGANGNILSQSNYINLQSNAYAAVQALGARGAGNEPSSIACIYGPNSGTIDATSAFKIYRRTGGVDSVPFMVNSAGNVGIGTTAPRYRLSNTAIVLSDYSSIEPSIASGFGWLASESNKYASSFSNNAVGGYGMNIYANSSGTQRLLTLLNSSGDVVNFLANGNVGIGTTSPTSKLQVTNGDVEIETVTSGIIMKAAGTSTRYRITLNATGDALVFTAI